MGSRGLIALAIVACASHAAEAGRKKKVQISSTPEGATVYLGDIENGPECETPCTVDVENGTIVILELKGHKPQIKPISFGRRERPPFKRSFTLPEAIGNLKVEGPEGAAVFLDDDDKGKIPFDEDVPAGTHLLHIKIDGKEVYSKPIEIPVDQVFKVSVPKDVATADDGDGDDTDPDPPDDDDTKKQIGVTKKSPERPRAGRLFSAAAAVTMGFRDFAYVNADPMRTDLAPEAERGQVLMGAAVEFWPGQLLGLHALRGLSLYGRAQIGVNPQAVVDATTNMPSGAKTFWRSFEASLQQRWVLSSIGVAVGGGYVRDVLRFSGSNIEQVPDCDYQAFRIGGTVSYEPGGHFAPFLTVENRVVFSGGALETRFPDAKANGLHGAAGVAVQYGHLGGRVEASLTRYAWTFRRDAGVDTDGANDDIKYVAVTVGYAY